VERKRKVEDGRKYDTSTKVIVQEQSYNSSSTPETMMWTGFSSYHRKRRTKILIINLEYEIPSCQALQSCYAEVLEHATETHQTNL
jgi:transposase